MSAEYMLRDLTDGLVENVTVPTIPCLSNLEKQEVTTYVFTYNSDVNDETRYMISKHEDRLICGVYDKDDNNDVTIHIRGCKSCCDIIRELFDITKQDYVLTTGTIVRYIDEEEHFHPGQQAYLECEVCNPYTYDTWRQDAYEKYDLL